MIYSNDESDKKIRFKNHLLAVYIAPLILALVIGGVVYLCVLYKLLLERELYYGFFLSLTPSLFLHSYNKKYWLKMPDGTFHNVKNIGTSSFINTIEPLFYEDEFYYSKEKIIISIIMGFVAIGMSVLLFIHYSELILIPFGTAVFGLFLSLFNVKKLFDKTAKLKIAKNGLWTNKLGFVNWDEINFAEVVEDNSGKTPVLYLNIRLKGTKFEEANQPDERLLLSDLKNKEDIEAKINESIIAYNELRK